MERTAFVLDRYPCDKALNLIILSCLEESIRGFPKVRYTFFGVIIRRIHNILGYIYIHIYGKTFFMLGPWALAGFLDSGLLHMGFPKIRATIFGIVCWGLYGGPSI